MWPSIHHVQICNCSLKISGKKKKNKSRIGPQVTHLKESVSFEVLSACPILSIWKIAMIVLSLFLPYRRSQAVCCQCHEFSFSKRFGTNWSDEQTKMLSFNTLKTISGHITSSFTPMVYYVLKFIDYDANADISLMLSNLVCLPPRNLQPNQDPNEVNEHEHLITLIEDCGNWSF